MDYEFAVQWITKLHRSEVPQVYTTSKTEKQSEQNMMGVIRARTRKASILPREYGPMNWYNAPLNLDGKPFRFLWHAELLRQVITGSLRTSYHAPSNYELKLLRVPNQYWKEPVGYPLARPIVPIVRGQEHLHHHIEYLDVARLQQWIEAPEQVRQRNLSCRMAPVLYEPACHLQGRMTMLGDMPQVLRELVNSVLGPELRA